MRDSSEGTKDWLLGMPYVGDRSLSTTEGECLRVVAGRQLALALLGTSSFVFSPLITFAALVSDRPSKLFLVVAALILMPWSVFALEWFAYVRSKRALNAGRAREFSGRGKVDHDDWLMRGIRSRMNDVSEVKSVLVADSGLLLSVNGIGVPFRLLPQAVLPISIAEGPRVPSNRGLNDDELRELGNVVKNSKSTLSFVKWWWVVAVPLSITMVVIEKYGFLFHVAVISAAIVIPASRQAKKTRDVIGALEQDLERRQVRLTAAGDEILPASKCVWRNGSYPAKWRLTSTSPHMSTVPEVGEGA